MGWIKSLADKIQPIDANPVVVWLLKVADFFFGTIQGAGMLLFVILWAISLSNNSDLRTDHEAYVEQVKEKYITPREFGDLQRRLTACEIKTSRNDSLNYVRAMMFDSVMTAFNELKSQVRYMDRNQSAIQNKIDNATKTIKNETRK